MVGALVLGDALVGHLAAFLADSTTTLTLWQVVTIAVAVLGEVLAVVFVYRVLVRGGSPASNLLWVVVILAAPWLGLLLYYLLPRQLQRRRLRRIMRRGARARQARPAPGEAGAAAGGAEEDRGDANIGSAAVSGLRALLEGEDGGGLRAGNTVEWISGGEEFFAAAEAAIRGAQREVHCVVYILRPDEAGLRFLGWLTDAAARGVTVRLLFDSMGSFGLKSSHLAPLRRAGGHAVAFMPLLWKRRPFTINLRNHRKVLLVDGGVAFVGGRNIGNEYKTGRLGRTMRWLDAMVCVHGPAVAMLQDVFVEDWCTATDVLLEDVAQPDTDPVGREQVAVTCSGPDREQQRLWYAIVQAIGEAETSVDLVSPYLLPPPVLFFALELAVARGVRVRLHTNGRASEVAVLYWAQRSYYRRLLQAGVEVYETVRDYIHTKLLLIDGRTVLIGSANMDLRSAALNFEVAVVVVDAPGFATEVLRTLSEQRAAYRRVTEEALPVNPFWRAIDGLSNLLSPVL